MNLSGERSTFSAPRRIVCLRKKGFRCHVGSTSKSFVVVVADSADIVVNIGHEFDHVLFHGIGGDQNVEAIEIHVRDGDKSIQRPTMKPVQDKQSIFRTSRVSRFSTSRSCSPRPGRETSVLVHEIFDCPVRNREQNGDSFSAVPDSSCVDSRWSTLASDVPSSFSPIVRRGSRPSLLE